MADARTSARAYTRQHGEDPPEVSGWVWNADPTAPR
jgi:xylulose-5-phosphate/fructose-6-phosphate phosphoketolase